MLIVRILETMGMFLALVHDIGIFVCRICVSLPELKSARNVFLFFLSNTFFSEHLSPHLIQNPVSVIIKASCTEFVG